MDCAVWPAARFVAATVRTALWGAGTAAGTAAQSAVLAQELPCELAVTSAPEALEGIAWEQGPEGRERARGHNAGSPSIESWSVN